MTRRLARSGLLLALAAPLLVAAPLVAADDDGRPAFSFLRQDEDWSAFSPPEPPDDPLDRLKVVDLDDDGSVWASFGASARARFESWESFGFGGAVPAEDQFSLWRLLVHADVRFGERARVFVEVKSALAGGRDLPGGTRPLDADTLDLQQAFIDARLGRSNWTLRLGRQALQYGRQRLVSPLPWGNALRSWDGAAVRHRRGKWSSDLFWTRPVTIERTDWNGADDDRSFYGVQAARNTPGCVLEAYAFGLERETTVAFNGTSGDEKRRTFGSRLVLFAGRPLGLEVEAAYQSGDLGGQDISAWMAAVEGRWQAPGRWKPLVRVAFDAASGDDAFGGDVETFDQLFPLGHAYFGYADAFGRQNVVSPSVSLAVTPTERLRLLAAFHDFRRESREDAVYNAGGGVLVPAAAGVSRSVASEIDVVGTVRVTRHTTLEVGISRVFARDFLEQAGLGDDTSFGYAQAEFRF